MLIKQIARHFHFKEQISLKGGSPAEKDRTESGSDKLESHGRSFDDEVNYYVLCSLFLFSNLLIVSCTF